jgi:hypothetical protein
MRAASPKAATVSKGKRISAPRRPEVLHPPDNPLEAQVIVLVRLGQRPEDRPTHLGGEIDPSPDGQDGEIVRHPGLVDDLLGGGPVRGVEDAQVG